MRFRVSLSALLLMGLLACTGCFRSGLAPQASILADKLDAAVFRFSAEGAFDPDGLVVRIEWDFGDGTDDVGLVVTHEYAEPGEYVVWVRVTDDEGHAGETEITVVAGCVIHVPGDFATITEAIAAAIDGDVIQLGAQTFREYIDFAGKAITIRGAEEMGTTLMRPPIEFGPAPHSIVTFDSGECSDAVLENLMIQGDQWEMYAGSAILLLESSPTIRGCVFSTHRAQFGGAVYASDSAAQFIGNRFLSNHAKGDGGAVCAVGNAAFPDFYDNEFADNRADAGGAIRLQARELSQLAPTVQASQISGNTFRSNQASGAQWAIGMRGGAIHVGAGVPVVLSGNVFEGNSPTDVFFEDAYP